MTKGQKIILDLKERFEKALQAKTGWGRLEIMKAFDNALIEAMANYIEN
jgi:hypothetical protein